MRYKLHLLLLASLCTLIACESQFFISSSRRSAFEDCADKTVAEPSDACRKSTEQSQRAAKLHMDHCIDPDLSKLLSTEYITLCDGTEAKGELSIAPSDIRSGVIVAGLAGSYSGVFPNCADDGDQSCVVTGAFKAVDTTGLASKVIATAAVAGVAGSVVLPAAEDVMSGTVYGESGSLTGSKWPTKQCRNAADLTTWDVSGLSNIDSGSLPLTVANIDISTDEINFNPSIYYLTTDFPVLLTSSGTLPGGLSAATTYYVIVSGTKIKLATSPGGAAIDITSTGSGSLRLMSAPDASVGVWDTIDDYNNSLVTAPIHSPWDATYVCDDSNFTNISSSGDPSLTPPGTTPAGATAAFSEIWRDELTGLLFTNIIYDGSGSVNWAGAMAMCANLDSGDGSGKWRIPTQKELMQLYIDGVSKVSVSGGDWATAGNSLMWSSSTSSYDFGGVWGVSLALGNSTVLGRQFSGYGIFCVR